MRGNRRDYLAAEYDSLGLPAENVCCNFHIIYRFELLELRSWDR